ncbi:LOW QUALITY PROTEIN: NADH-cytochrome b5 reductase-like [Sminthopsis crassicaudata]|uniref:LOW QUALITY PROTEIN: NADH-cytochrome b5 reductase-like n=1 Tax=Sminthopsis crassicaudata TaxID=9301 RepID=UPI003D6979AB
MMEEEEEEEEDEESWLQLRPIEPLPSQCCGYGCKPCIFDIYYQELDRWEKARAKKDKSLLWRKKEELCLSELSQETFEAFRISAMEQLTDDTCQVRFEPPESRRLGLSPGQHLILQGTVNGLEIQRAYTPISYGNSEGYFEVLIKCYEKGLMSQHVKSWKVGDTAFWRGPFGGFPYKPNQKKQNPFNPVLSVPESQGLLLSWGLRDLQYGELLMLASGTGLAPMLPILKEITANEVDETFVTLVSCFRTFRGVYLKPLLEEQARYWNVRTVFVLSQEAALDTLPWSYQEKTHLGRLNQALVCQLVSSCRRKPFALVCGSPQFLQDMTSCLRGAGLTEDSYFLF